jgi:WD40 repeat protein
LEQEPVSPRLLNPSVPRDLETVCLKCLEKEPSRRYGSAQDLADELGRFLGEEPIHARPVGPVSRVWRWGCRRPLVAGLLVALHLVFAIGLAGVLWQWQAARRAQRETTERLYESYLAQARGMRLSETAGRRQAELDLLAKAVAIRPSLELRNEAIATLATRDVRLGRIWQPADPASVGAWHFDGDFRHYALADGTNGVLIRRVSDDGEVAVLRHASRVVKRLYGVHALSPDGRCVAVNFTGEKHGVVWDVATARVLVENLGFQHGIDFSRDGNRFAASHADGTIRIHDLGSGKEVASLKAGRPLNFLRFNTKGDRVLGCKVGETQFNTWELATGKLQTFSAPDRLNYADWGAGELLAAGAATGRIYIWDSPSGQLRQIIPAHDSEIQLVAFNHRGDLLASVSWDGQTRFSNPWTGRVEVELPRQSAGLMFSRDDTQCGLIVESLGAGSGHALLEIQESPVLRRVDNSGHLTHAWTLTFSPDGRWLASAFGESGGIRVFEVAGRKPVAVLPECVGRTVLFEPDGRGLLTTGPEGILRVPLAAASRGTNLTGGFGPPQVISPVRDVAMANLSKDGRWLAFTTYPHEVWLLDLTDPKPAVLLGQQRSALAVAVSPDGKYVASGNWHGNDGVWIWNTRTVAVVKRIPMALVKLNWSPDGRWVSVTGTTDGHVFKLLLLEAGSWRVRHESEALASAGHCAFSPDSRLVAFICNDGRAIRLHEIESFRQLATLEAPHHGQAVWLAFSPDGDRLAAQEYRQGIQLWDLTRLRAELRQRGLDWESPD